MSSKHAYCSNYLKIWFVLQDVPFTESVKVHHLCKYYKYFNKQFIKVYVCSYCCFGKASTVFSPGASWPRLIITRNTHFSDHVLLCTNPMQTGGEHANSTQSLGFYTRTRNLFLWIDNATGAAQLWNITCWNDESWVISNCFLSWT